MGPLKGLKVVELAGIGPGPFCATLLADMGADVLRIDRTGESGLGLAAPPKYDVLTRNRRSIAVDLKKPEGVETVLKLVEQADALIEGFRPGVAERLGLGPEDCKARNPRLVYGRMTGWGQDGPISHAAGHDLNYIALSGVLNTIGRKGGPPTPPLNLVGDFGGGGMFLAFGVVSAVMEARQSGEGQVVDVSMVEGAAYLAMPFWAMTASGRWTDERGTNVLDSGAPFYDVYETKDGRYVSIASIEVKFYEELLELSGLKEEDLPAQMSREDWPSMKEKFAAVFRTKTRDEWDAIMEGSDVCYAPVLSIKEAPEHPHNKARGTFIEVDGVLQPGPAPKFSRTPTAHPSPPPKRGEHTEAALAEWGFGEDAIASLRETGAIAQA